MKFAGKLLGWYEKNKRDLPWRHTSDPYRIWLSEVILQQTRVEQGLGYYRKFIERFPDVGSLAAAGEDEVMKLWQGLGYYSRARNLHRAAKDVVEQREGMMPGTYEGLLEMKGVGTYTAAAIASICFGEPRAVVDGNVSRVLARLFLVEDAVNATGGSRIVASLAGKMLEQGLADGCDPGTHNQAMMEFGALQCVPSSPGCNNCPLSGQCGAHLAGRVDSIPVKIPKRKPVDRWMYFYIIVGNGETILQKRAGRDIWKSLYQFPVTENDAPLSREELAGDRVIEVMKQFGSPPEAELPAPAFHLMKFSGTIRHQLTHRTIHACFIHVEVMSLPPVLPAGFIPVPLSAFAQYPVPRLISRYMESAKF